MIKKAQRYNHNDPKKEEWNSFWKENNITSFVDRFSEGYDGEIKEFWQQNLRPEAKFDKIIDLGCGNGAISWLCNEILNRKEGRQKSEIIGIDSADIHPFEALNKNPVDFPEVKFIGNTEIEKLPFNDGEIDLAISQWGIEYSNFNSTIQELSRALKKDSRIMLVCHTENSSIIDITHKTLESLYLIIEEELHEKLCLLNETVIKHGNKIKNLQNNDSRTAIEETQLCVKKILSILERKNNGGARHAQELVVSITKQVNNSIKQSVDCNPIILQNHSEMKKAISRLEYLVEASLTKKRIIELENALISEGFALTSIKHINQKNGKGKAKNMGVIGIAFIAERGELLLSKDDYATS